MLVRADSVYVRDLQARTFGAVAQAFLIRQAHDANSRFADGCVMANGLVGRAVLANLVRRSEEEREERYWDCGRHDETGRVARRKA